MDYSTRKFILDNSGATAIEYALIASAIFLAIVAGVGSVGEAVTAKFESVAAGLGSIK